MGEKSENKQGGAPTFVFKVDLHCEGCAQKVRRNLKNLTGVESLKTDVVTNKVTVVGKVDPALVKKRLEDKIKKPVEFVSPKTDQKDDEGNAKKPDEKMPQEKKPKEVEVVTTVVLKTDVHCDGCANKMSKILSKYKGVQSVNVELQKDQITVKGTMDVKEMLPYLSAKFKRPVELFSPPAKKSGDGEGKSKEVAKIPAEEIVENVHKMEYGYPYYNGYGTHFYNPQQAPAPEYAYVAEYGHAPHYLHAPQMFSDENPNACSVM